MLQTGGVLVELPALLAQQLLQTLPAEGGQVADGVDAVLVQYPGRRPAHEEKVGHRQRPHLFRHVCPGEDGGCVWLFHVAAQLGKNLVERDTHTDGETSLFLHGAPDLVGDGPAVPTEEVHGAGNVQPALVDAKGLHQIGVPLIDGVDPLGPQPVLVVVGGEEDEIGAFPPGLPDGLRRLDLEFLGRLVLGQDDAVAALRVAAHRHRLVLQLRLVPQLHRGVKAVEVAVQDGPVHVSTPFSSVYHRKFS